MKERLAFLQNRKSFSRQLLKTSFLLSLFVVIILSAILSPFFVKIARSYDESYEEELLYAYLIELEELEKSAERRKRSIESAEWLHDLYIDHVLNEKNLSPHDKDEIAKDLRLWIADDNRIAQISLSFFDDPETLYSDKGVFSNVHFYRENYPDNIQYQIFDGREGLNCVSFSGVDKLVYCSTVTDILNGRAKATLNIIFYDSRFRENVLSKTNREPVAVGILTAEGEQLWSAGTSETNEKVFRISRPSVSGRYLCELVLPASVHHRSLNNMLPYYIAAILLAAVIGFDFSVFFSMKNYKPVALLMEKTVIKGSTRQNEFETIDLAVDSMRIEGKKKEEELALLRPVVRQKLLEKLLDGSAFLNESLQKQSASCGVRLDADFYLVVSAFLPELSDSEAGIEEYGISDAALAFRRIAIDLCEEKKIDCYVLFKDRTHSKLLLAYGKGVPVLEMTRHLAEAISSIYNDTSLPEGPQFGLGGVIDSAESIYYSANQADQALHFARANQMGTIVSYSEIASQLMTAYRYSFSEEILLARSISEGNRAGAHRLVRDVLQSNSSLMDRDAFANLFRDLWSTVLRTASDVFVSLPQGPDDTVPASLKSMEERLTASIDFICNCIEKRSINSVREEEQAILDYLDSHVYDASLSLNDVAEYFNKSPSFISLLIKRKLNANYTDFVNEKRIHRAVELMATERKSPAEVYHEVGYVSISTFKRNLDKYSRK